MKAIKKPVTVECVKWDGENLEEVKNFCGPSYIGGGKDDDKKLVISTLEGDMLASVGDFIIKGVKGEFYPCKPDIFEQTYDIVEVSIKDVKFNGVSLEEYTPPIVKVRAEVRYFEDGKVNGENDISYEEQEKGIRPKIPCTERNVGENLEACDMWAWCLEIDPERGVIMNWPEGNTASVHYKVCDGCHIEYFEKGKKICDNERDGYVPEFLCPNGEGYGDYMIMEIDGCGFISNWKKEKFEQWVNSASRIDED